MSRILLLLVVVSIALASPTSSPKIHYHITKSSSPKFNGPLSVTPPSGILNVVFTIKNVRNSLELAVQIYDTGDVECLKYFEHTCKRYFEPSAIYHAAFVICMNENIQYHKNRCGITDETKDYGDSLENYFRRRKCPRGYQKCDLAI